MLAINKARTVCKRAAALCADADAEVATYWKTDGRSVRPNAWATHSLRQLATEVFGQAHELQLHAEWAATLDIEARRKAKPAKPVKA